MVLELFHPWVREWFESAYTGPTPPQAAAWPAIAAGGHVLIHAPTGSGKTLAAFLWSINGLIAPRPDGQSGKEAAEREAGVQVLYVSPLKALNYDIERNLLQPLAGVARIAERRGSKPRIVKVAVRTGDTPARERAAMVRKPPHILITTPESLYLILGSPQARRILRTVRTVIVDEIHAVCGTKRGAHLVLSLERLEQLAPGFQRIGLSATQRPLDEVARFLGGRAVQRESSDGVGMVNGDHLVERPVKIVDTPYMKRLEMRVLGMPEAVQAAFPGSIWPQLIPKVLDDVRSHRTTLIFCNSRMQAERTADRLNAESVLQDAGHGVEEPALAPGGAPIGEGLIGTGLGVGVFKAHHGSIAEPVRRALEEDLKAGRLPALIGTSSLELGIDIGSVDLVVQIQSPKSVSRGLQRVGRSGHLVGGTSKGKIYATHNEDLIEAAVVVRGMLEREVEAIRIIRNPLDVVAQQVVAAVSVDDWKAGDLFDLCRRAYPFSDLSRKSFDSVLRLVSGRYPAKQYRALRARVYWDESHGLLTALPGSRLHAIANGGTIVDRGEFAVYLPDGKTRLGELDEEFVWESRAGDVFTLGSQVWRALEIRDDRVIAEPAPGALPRMPFWKGEFPWRPFELSLKLGRFRGELAERMAPYLDREDDPPELMTWLTGNYHLDDAGARQILGYVRRQLRTMGTISSDRTVVVETYPDSVGDRRMVVHSPFGGKVNAGWAIALAAEIADRAGVQPDMQVSDDGIMFRLPEADSPVPVDIVQSLDAAAVKERLLQHMDESPLFGALFRQNATRSLLMPVSIKGKRTPFWLQRRRAKDLLAIAREFPDFPVLLETYRDCLEDALDLAAIERVLGDIKAGRIRVEHVESKVPSPVAQSLNYAFTNVYLYEWDAPRAERASHVLQLDRTALAALFKDPAFAGFLRQDAVEEVVARASSTAPGFRARSAIELAELLENAGDLNLQEIRQRCDGDPEAWLADLESRGLVTAIEVPVAAMVAIDTPVATATDALEPVPGRAVRDSERRWIAATRIDDLQSLWSAEAPEDRAHALKSAVQRFLSAHGLLTIDEISARYRVPGPLVEQVLRDLEAEEVLVSGNFTGGAGALEWADPDLIANMQARTLGILRREVRPVSPLRYAALVRRRQGVSRSGTRSGEERVRKVFHQLRGLCLPVRAWNEVVLPARLGHDCGQAVEAVVGSGDFVWLAVVLGAGDESRRLLVTVFPRASGRLFLPDAAFMTEPVEGLSPAGERLWEFLRGEGTATSSDIRDALGDLSLTDVRNALAETTRRGLVTANSWQVLTALDETPWQGFDGLSTELSPTIPVSRTTRRRSGARGESPSRAIARAIREAASALPPDVQWSASSRFATLGAKPSPAERARAHADALADRYGVVTRYGLANESSPWPWEPIVAEFGLLELRGKIRRGYFVAGLPGLQFAAGIVVDELRESPDAGEDVVLVNAADPAFALDRSMFGSMFGSIPDAPKLLSSVARVPSSWVAFSGDLPVLVAEDDGRRILADDSTVHRDAVRSAIELLRGAAGRGGKRVSVETWNGSPVLKSLGADALASAGFRRDYPGMIFDEVQARVLLKKG